MLVFYLFVLILLFEVYVQETCTNSRLTLYWLTSINFLFFVCLVFCVHLNNCFSIFNSILFPLPSVKNNIMTTLYAYICIIIRIFVYHAFVIVCKVKCFQLIYIPDSKYFSSSFCVFGNVNYCVSNKYVIILKCKCYLNVILTCHPIISLFKWYNYFKCKLLCFQHI